MFERLMSQRTDLGLLAEEYDPEASRMSGELPVTIYRPSSVVGDSSTGEIDRFEGPYYLGILLVMSPLVVALPLPGDGVAPLNVVPADYVSAAAWAVADTAGRRRCPKTLRKRARTGVAGPTAAGNESTTAVLNDVGWFMAHFLTSEG